MKIRFWSLLSITVLLCFLFVPATVLGSESFSVKEYEKFHDVLQLLQHEALPNKNYGEIRLKAKSSRRHDKKARSACH